MTVFELIERLKGYDPDLTVEVEVRVGSGWSRNYWAPATGVFLHERSDAPSTVVVEGT